MDFVIEAPLATIKYSGMDFSWVVSHYDGIHLKGYCHYNGNLCRFEVVGDYFAVPQRQIRYIIFSLTSFEKIKMLFNKKMFELCVSRTWSYPKKLEIEKPVWLSKLLHDFYYRFWIK